MTFDLTVHEVIGESYSSTIVFLLPNFMKRIGKLYKFKLLKWKRKWRNTFELILLGYSTTLYVILLIQFMHSDGILHCLVSLFQSRAFTKFTNLDIRSISSLKLFYWTVCIICDIFDAIFHCLWILSFSSNYDSRFKKLVWQFTFWISTW